MPAAGARILLVEDDPGMAVLAADSLIDVEDSTLTVAESAAECRAHIARQAFDVVLLDRGLPDCDGAALIGEIIAQQPDAAIVMLSGADSADSATETLLLGAWDYIVKRPDLQHLRELPAVIRRCVERKRWRENEARLRTEMEMLLTALRGTGDAVIMADTERRVHFWNAAAERLFGWRAEDVLGQPLPMVPADRELESMDLMARARSGDPLVGFETVRQRRDGSLVEVSLTLTTALNLDGSVYAYVSVIRDISERKALERARADFAAMLTHDLKNPLAVIQGCAKLLEEAGCVHRSRRRDDRQIGCRPAAGRHDRGGETHARDSADCRRCSAGERDATVPCRRRAQRHHPAHGRRGRNPPRQRRSGSARTRPWQPDRQRDQVYAGGRCRDRPGAVPKR